MSFSRLVFLRALLLVTLLAGIRAVADEALPPRTVRVLFIGNSYTYANDLPGITAQLLAARGIKLEHESVAAGGATLEKHWAEGKAVEAIRKSKWDYVVLQEQSARPMRNREAMFKAGRLLSAKIGQAGAKTLLYETWAAKAAPDEQPKLTDAYESLGRELGATVVPAGEAWKQAIAAGFQLHWTDGRHPNRDGSYLAACLFVVALTGESPVGLPNEGVTEGKPWIVTNAPALQCIAAETPLVLPKSSAIDPKSVLAVMERVADWQLANPSRHPTTDWTQGAGCAGFMALADISKDAKYREAMVAIGETNAWKLGRRKYFADDHAIGQTYLELYLTARDPKMIAPLRAHFDDILAHPPDAPTLDNRGQFVGQAWSWCDALFMGPPVWLRLYAATGDQRYRDFAVTNWWRTSDYLYDPNEHLYFRDSNFFEKREANGRKIFWSRGNGWVMAGLARVLPYLPKDDPDRARFETQFKEMAAAVLACQQPDGLWRASLLDPVSYPLKETSGSAFYTYALAWGVNQGLLNRETYQPAVVKAWSALVECVEPDGKLTRVQPIGHDPKNFDEHATEVYGVGAFLLAGSEVYRLEK